MGALFSRTRCCRGRPRVVVAPRLTALTALTALAALVVTAASLVGVATAARMDAPPIPPPGRTEVAGAHWPGRGLVVVSGGFVPAGGTSTDVLFFDLRTGEWRPGPALPGRRDHAAMAVVAGDLYLVGGYTAGLRGATAEVYRLDDPGGVWQAVAAMSTARAALAVSSVEGRLVALGGVDAAGRVLRSTEVYDPGADRWVAGPAMTVPREHFGAATRRGRVYAVAGRNPGNLTSVESLRFRRGRPVGSFRSEPPLAFARGGSGAATVRGVLCTAGGEEPAGTIAPVECLVAGRWQHVADLAVPRHGLVVAGEGSRLRVISGGPEPGLAFGREHEVFDVRALTGPRP